MEASRRLCGSEQAVVGTFIENSRLTAADHRLAKSLCSLDTACIAASE